MSILNKGISNISEAEQQAILEQWTDGKYVEKPDWIIGDLAGGLDKK